VITLGIEQCIEIQKILGFYKYDPKLTFPNPTVSSLHFLVKSDSTLLRFSV
jgi:hypothetical protein